MESIRELYHVDWQRMIVHDMKNPLAVILANLDLLSKCRLRAREEDLLDSALKGCRDLQRMIQGFLRIARMEDRGPSLELCVVPVGPFFQRLEEMWTAPCRDRNAHLQIDLDHAPATLVADESLLERILSNLVRNAIAQIRRGGRIGIRVWNAASGRIRISVSDNGAGMPEEVKAALVRPLPGGRAGDTAAGPFLSGSGRDVGFGIGLAFCRLACELHGGKIWAEGASSRGTVVHVDLPADLVPSGSGLLDGPEERVTRNDHGNTRA
ncbi:MAG: HAMP domain-containing histidine kinase [Syntrophaceae bacterium]|nr:HAMP domain-containing histidine kinase [Syntrophaceae bacterium]